LEVVVNDMFLGLIMGAVLSPEEPKSAKNWGTFHIKNFGTDQKTETRSQNLKDWQIPSKF
jgi:hypothetical protein